MQDQQMGNCPFFEFQKNKEARYKKLLSIIKNQKLYFQDKYQQKLENGDFKLFTLIHPKDQHRLRFQNIFENLHNKQFSPEELNLSTKESRGIAVMLGMAICDALGASTEFCPYTKQGLQLIKNGFQDIIVAIKKRNLMPRHGCVGVWTDDASMGLAMAYSLLLNEYNFNPVNTRYMFHLWLQHGLGNGGRDHSIGLGGNIAISMKQFALKNMNSTKYEQSNLAKTEQKDRDNNGNGSLMRLAPIPVTFFDNQQKALKAAEQQSLTTHNGLEAKQCSRLMTKIIIELINQNSHNDPKKHKQFLIQICDNFKSQQKSVEYLAKGKMQTQEMFQYKMKNFKSFGIWNKGLKDRNWNWRDPQFNYSPSRIKQHSGYVGSYCMDGLAMALHMVYFTDSFQQCAIKCADMGGDCDTVGSIAGQIAGAMYGIDSKMLSLYSQMDDYKQGRYEVFLVGYKLVNRVPMNQITEEEDKKKNQNKLEQNQDNAINENQQENKEEDRYLNLI